MEQNKPVILIGSLTKENRGAIPTITKAFIEGLQSEYHFIPHYADRKYGNTRTSNFNPPNLYYFIKHFSQWIYNLIIYRPDIAHYPITSYWNLEKSLIFLKVAKLFGCKTIGHLHGGAFDNFWDNLSMFRKSVALRLFESVDWMIVLSEYWKDYIIGEVGLHRVTVLNNPIDKDFELKTIKAVRKKGENQILFVGSLGKRKGVYDILRVATELKDQYEFEISLIGPEDRVDDIQKIGDYIREHQIEQYVSVLGSLFDDYKIAAFVNSDIFLFPSYNENFPLVIIEAACAGLPIVTTPVGASPEFFENEKSVIFVEPGNIEQIKNAVVDLLNNPEKRKRLGEGARQVFEEKLSRDNIMNQLDKVYRNICLRR